MVQEGTRRLAAVCLTELVGLDELAQTDGDAARRALREFKHLAGARSEANGGRPPRALGDALLTVFDSVDGALRAAVEVRDGIQGHREAVRHGVAVQAAVHFGDVTEAPNGDAYGEAVNTAARVKAMAEPGQVVVTDIAYRLLQDRGAFAVDDLGEHELKGEADPLRLRAARLVEQAPTADLRDLLQHELAPLQILEVEGFGGMGEIYLARDPGLRRTLAVKVLRSEFVADAQARARFQREAQVIAGLSHPNVVGVHSVGELKDGTPYFVMDYVEGGSLADRLEREGPLTLAETRRIVGEIASALAAAHAKGVVHRDIKASNILYDVESGRSLVTDWGIAALDPTQELSPETRLTQTGMVVGSPEFMSPEQLAGDEVGPETDVYSLGLLAYELLTGKGPFEATTPRALMIAHLREDPPRLAEVRDDVDVEFESVVMRCLAKSPADRATAEEIASRFAPGAEAVLEWPPPGLEAVKGVGTSNIILALTAVAMLVGPLLMAFGARVNWSGRVYFQDLVYGPSGVMVLVILTLGILGALFLALTLARRQEGVLVTSRKMHDQMAAVDPLSRAFRLGYGWKTVLEVLNDRWGDHGNLVAGLREYAILDAEGRSRARRRRLRRSGLRWAGTLLTPVTLLVAVHFVSEGTVSPGMGLALGFALPGLCLLASLLPVDSQEVRLARAGLAVRAPSPEVLRPQVEAWNETHRAVTGASGPDPGRPTSRRTFWAYNVGTALFGAIPYMYGLAGLLVMIPGSMAYSSRASSPLVTQSRFERMRSAEALRLPPDSTLDPATAGDILEELTGPDVPLSTWSLQRPSQETIPDSPLLGSALAPPYTLSQLGVIPAAAGGLSPAEVAYLRGFSGDPRLPLFRRLARAPSYVMGSPERYPPDMIYEKRPLPVVGSSLGELALHELAVAGLHLAEGDPEAAEETLRGIFSVGWLLAEESNEAALAVAGRNIATLAMDALAQLEPTGPATEASTPDPVEGAPASEDGVVVLSWRQQFERSLAFAADPTTVRALRIETLAYLQWAAQCTILDGIFLGLPPELRDITVEARAQLTRNDVDGAFLDMALHSQDRLVRYPRRQDPDASGEGAFDDGILLWTIEVAGRLFRNPRFISCPRSY